MPMRTTPLPEGDDAQGGEQGLRCDFCGAVVARVRRIALDRDYDRLQAPHAARYACTECSQRKELERLGLGSSSRR